MTDCKTGKVVVKGEKADPLKVLARVQRKTHRQVELISPIPPPSPPPEKKAEEEKPIVEEKKVEVTFCGLKAFDFFIIKSIYFVLFHKLDIQQK